MERSGANSRILTGIRKNCGSDDLLADFITQLFMEEVNNAGKIAPRWRINYMEKIKRIATKWEGEK